MEKLKNLVLPVAFTGTLLSAGLSFTTPAVAQNLNAVSTPRNTETIASKPKPSPKPPERGEPKEDPKDPNNRYNI